MFVAITLWRTNALPSYRGKIREETVQRLRQLAGPKLAEVCLNLLLLTGFDVDQMLGSKASSPTEQKSQIDFQFLNFSHPSDAKASRARRTVRSHVTRQQHQREHAAAAARRAKSFPQPEVEQEELPAPRATHAATFPSNRPTLELPTRPGPAGPAASSSDASSQSPSPTGSPMHPFERRIDPSDVYPEEWHPYLPRIMVRSLVKSCSCYSC